MAEENQDDPYDWRSGLVQSIGIILGFSLGFLGSWSLGDGDWQLIHVPALFFLVVGNGLLIASMYRLASPNYRKTDPHKLVKLFTWGLVLTLLGFVLAIVAAAIKGS